jgi:alkanesulfonate monooxygenase SsuD/methylene tetrahydromethanopterin reductase-like flavin-dependent oxidoreductase (luciferase family)
MALHAEAVGFDSLWFPDHLLVDIGAMLGEDKAVRFGIWECWSILSALAAITSRVEIGSFVACTNFRNPALLAKMADTLDEVSGGRLILGLGGGYHEPEFRAFGYPTDHLVGRFEEALTIIHGLLRNGRLDFEGKYYSARECELLPRGSRSGGPPILIGAGQPRMLALTARFADCWHTFGIHDPSRLDGARKRVDAACVEVNRDPATLQRTIAVMVDFPGAYAGRIGDTVRKYRSARVAPVTGSPEEIAARLRGFAQAGVTHVQIWPEPNTMAEVDLLAPALELLDRE